MKITVRDIQQIVHLLPLHDNFNCDQSHLDSRAFSGLPVAGNSDGLSPGLTVIDDAKRCREDMDPEETATHLHGSGMPPDIREETRKGVSVAVDGSTGAARDSDGRIDGC